MLIIDSWGPYTSRALVDGLGTQEFFIKSPSLAVKYAVLQAQCILTSRFECDKSRFHFKKHLLLKYF